MFVEKRPGKSVKDQSVKEVRSHQYNGGVRAIRSSLFSNQDFVSVVCVWTPSETIEGRKKRTRAIDLGA
jgi:hypothetical protein